MRGVIDINRLPTSITTGIARAMFAATVALCVLAPIAVAQDPTVDQYEGTVTRVEGFSNTGATASGDLPFTGFDIGLAMVVAAGLLGIGLMLRRAGRQGPA